MPNYIVTATSLRVRSGPGTTYPITGMLSKNQVVQGDEVNGDWVKVVTADNKTGWSSLDYLELIDEAPVPPSGTIYRVEAATLNLRKGPGTSYAVIGTLKLGEMVASISLSPDNQWAQIRKADRTTGWGSLKYLKKVSEPTPTPDPTPEPTPEPTPNPSQVTYRVDASTLYVRQGPGTTFGVVGSLTLGDIVDELGISPDSQWAQIRSAKKNITGWCSLKFLTQITAPPPPSPTDVLMYVTTDVLNYRVGPSDSYPVAGQLKKDDVVTYLSATPDWKWVNFKTPNNATGWVSSRYLNESNDLLVAPEHFPGKGLHRALSETIPLRSQPDENASTVAPMKFNRVVNVDMISLDGKWKHCINAWGEQGWYPIERLEKLDGNIVNPRSHEEFPWLSIAYAEFGTRETPGSKHNPKIVEYLMSTDLAEKYPSLPDETDWCAGFVNWCVEKAKIPSTNSAVVNPWRNWGKASNPPKRGAIICFLWDDGWAHVSMYLGDVGNYVICLGGNQSDAVWISVYHKKYVTSYRVY